MSKTFIKGGVKLVSGGTDNHLMLIDLSDKDVTGKELETMLDAVHITVNKNAVPFDKRKPTITSGIRIGTPAITTRGFNEDDCVKVAEVIIKIINEKESAFDYAAKEVKKLTEKYPLYTGIFKD